MENNKVKIIIDTNIFVGGIIFPKGNTDDNDALDIIFDLIDNEKVELIFSQDTIGEMFYVMKNKITYSVKKKLRLDYMHQLVDMFYFSRNVNTEGVNSPKCKDKHDDMFLQCAVASDVDYLITNDLKSGMNNVEGLKCMVLTSENFVELYNDNKLNNLLNSEVAATEDKKNK